MKSWHKSELKFGFCFKIKINNYYIIFDTGWWYGQQRPFEHRPIVSVGPRRAVHATRAATQSLSASAQPQSAMALVQKGEKGWKNQFIEQVLMHRLG